MELSKYDIILATALAWIIIPIIFSLPYMFFGLNAIDAIFESFSAITTTGFSFYSVSELESLPLSLRFWRSFEQWIGGIGILIFIIFVTQKAKIAFRTLKAEGKSEFFGENIIKSGKTIIKLYLWLTFVVMALLSFSGLNFFNSLNVAFTAIATGGMVPGIIPNNEFVKIAIMIGILLGMTNFKIIYKLVKGEKIKEWETLVYTALILIISFVFVFLNNKISLLDYLFHAVSALSCAGFSFVDLTKVPKPYFLYLVILMLIGGMVNSTAGAIKIDRLIIAIKGIKKYLLEFVKENFVYVVKYNGEVIEDNIIIDSMRFILIYLLVFAIASFAVSFISSSIEYAMFEVASAMGNVGLSVGIVNKTMPLIYKLLLYSLCI